MFLGKIDWIGKYFFVTLLFDPWVCGKSRAWLGSMMAIMVSGIGKLISSSLLKTLSANAFGKDMTISSTGLKMKR